MKLLQTELVDSTTINTLTSVEGIKEVLENSSIEEVMNQLLSWGVSFGGKLIAAAALFIVGKIVINWIYNLTQKVLSVRKVDRSLVTFVLSLIKIVLLILLII